MRLVAALAVSAALAAPALAQTTAATPAPSLGPPARFPAAHAGGALPLEQSPKRLPGYLTAETTPDAYAVLPPPPAPGTPTDEVDHQAYLATRALQGSRRWDLATRDAQESAAAVAADFDCALGADVTPERAPALLHLLTRLRADESRIVNRPKTAFARPRPFVTWGGPICTEAERADTAKSFTYPSGHATLGWTAGLVLAELAPDRATDVLARARAYGDSRVVCGVHYPTDVEAGRTTASMLAAALHADPQFRADLETARAELARLRAAPGAAAPAARQCAVEREAMARTPWLPPRASAPAPVVKPGA